MPGTGTRIASAGRCTPRARLKVNSDAASAAPVEPPETSAPASPAATALTAWTIDASGVPRTARAGSGAFAIETGASTTVDAVWDRAELVGGAEEDHARAGGRGDRRSASNLSWSEVGAVRVDRDRHRLRHRRSVLVPVRAACGA